MENHTNAKWGREGNVSQKEKSMSRGEEHVKHTLSKCSHINTKNHILRLEYEVTTTAHLGKHLSKDFLKK